jgi:hypothetical protein
MLEQIIKAAREFPEADSVEIYGIAHLRQERAQNAPISDYVPVSPAGEALQSLKLIGWKTLESMGVIHPVIQAARDLTAKKIGFGEFKRIVRENS